jgi:hypothetical protein
MAARDLVRLLDLDPDLGERLGPEARERARHELVAEVQRVVPGRWDAAGVPGPRRSGC